MLFFVGYLYKEDEYKKSFMCSIIVKTISRAKASVLACTHPKVVEALGDARALLHPNNWLEFKTFNSIIEEGRKEPLILIVDRDNNDDFFSGSPEGSRKFYDFERVLKI